MKRSVVFSILFAAAAVAEETLPDPAQATPEPSKADDSTPAPTPEPSKADDSTPAPTPAQATPKPTEFKAPAAGCADISGETCCDVSVESNEQCWTNLEWAQKNLGSADAPIAWYSEFGVTGETVGTDIPDMAMQCMLWGVAMLPDKKDGSSTPKHGCPRPCDASKNNLKEFKLGDFVCPAVPVKDTPEPEAPKKEKKPSLGIPLWAVILISLVAIGAIIAGVIFYLSNDKSPQKKKKKRGVAAAPQKKAPEPEAPAPVVATAAPIYTTAAPLTYTTAAPVSAGSFVYAPQPVVTTGVPVGSVYQAGPVLTQATPIATSQPRTLQAGGASWM